MANSSETGPDEAAPPSVIDGLVQRFDAAGRLLEEASFCGGRLDGPFRLYGSDGRLRRLACYVDGLAEGLATDFDEAGAKVAETHWRAGLRHGEARLYAEGRLAVVLHWQDGKLEGPLCSYAPSGDLAAMMPHRAGRMDGTMRIYHPNGCLMLEAEQVDGIRHGTSVLYDTHGREIERVTYVQGCPAEAQATPSQPAPGEPATRAFYATLAQERQSAAG